MLIFWQELRKISRQLRGSENIFGYKSTVANQLYLLYFFGGSIYFTDKIHNQVKFFWYGVVLGQSIYAFVIGLQYLWYERITDLVMLMHVVNFVGLTVAVMFVFPLITYLCSGRIEAMIKHVDDILARESDPGFKQNKILADAKKYLTMYLTPTAVCYSGYSFLCIPDVVLFFEEEKLSNSIYYVFPPPEVEEYSSMWSFFIGTSITSFVYFLMVAQACSVFCLLLYWNVICSTLLISIRNDSQAKTYDLNTYTDEEIQLVGEWNRVFDGWLEHIVKEFQETICIINYLKVLFEVIGTLLIVISFWVGMTVLYTCITDDMSLLLKVKFMMGYMITVTAVFLFYWIGQNLNNSVSEVSLAVYSTPWYRSVKIRKVVHMFLCQTQLVKNFAVFTVYRLLLYNFSRYLHTQMSFTNILRRLTMK